MSDVKKGEGLVYKNHPLRRVDNLIYYGSMADKYIVMFRFWKAKRSRIWMWQPAYPSSCS